MRADRKKILWALISLVLALLTIYAVISQSRSFSFAVLWKFIKRAHKGWLLGAVLCMLNFIWFEGIALVRIADRLGYRRHIANGFAYGGADVYFSAITPSATGGQPASAYFMIKDGMPVSAVTAALLINLVMYTLALLLLGALDVCFCFPLFQRFSLISKLFIAGGEVILVILAVFFYLLLRKQRLLHTLADKFLHLLEKLHLVRRAESRRKKLEKISEEYSMCADLIFGKGSLLLEVFFWNLVQRISQLLVSFMIFMAMGQGVRRAFDIVKIQCFVAVGSNSVPVPGAIGAADLLMLDGLKMVVDKASVVNMELLCRGISFYASVSVSLLIVIIAYVRRKLRDRRTAEGREPEQERPGMTGQAAGKRKNKR